MHYLQKYPVHFLGLLTILLVGIASVGRSQDAVTTAAESQAAPAITESSVVYQIPIEDMIEPSLVYILRRGLSEARKADADAIVFLMDTPGGRVDTTEEIVRLIETAGVPTYTFVEQKAISAGAIIALSTDHIYMAPGSRIGDAMPIIASPQGGMQSLGEAEREKIESYVDSLVRGIAQRKGRDETMASAMVRRSVEYKIGDEVICKEGELLTLTHLEAEKIYEIDGVKRPLLSEGTVDDVEAMLDKVGLKNPTIHKLEVTDVEKFARLIATIAPILMTIGMLALWIEFQTPGIGIGAIVGAICLGLFFFGHHIAGLAGHEELLLFVLGVILLLIEIFAFPGFGLIGLTGICLIMWSLLVSMAPNMPNAPVIPSLPDLKGPIQNMMISAVMTGIGMLLISRFLPKSKATSWLVLKESTSIASGYSSHSDLSGLKGQIGKAVTPLHPGGSAMFGDSRRDVVTEGEFINSGTDVKVIAVSGEHIVVEAAREEAQS